jgi:hypothetical protein
VTSPWLKLVFMSLGLALLFAAPVRAEEEKAAEAPPSWARSGPFLRGGALRQFEADLEKDGDFSVNRFYGEIGYNFLFSREFSAALAAGYSFDHYDFSGDEGIAGLDPFDDVEQIRFSARTRYAFNRYFALFVVPTLRFSAEHGGNLGDGVSGGGFLGLSWKASDTLTIGPGFGVLTEIEDDVSIFPFLVLDWRITEELSFGTGRGIGASRAPGLAFSWKFAEQSELSLGGRYESTRFRLDRNDFASKGVAEESSFPVFLSLSHKFSEQFSAGIVTGVNFAGSLRIEDQRGHRLAREDYDPAFFLGLTASFRF